MSDKEPSDTGGDNAGVKVPPPLIFLVLLLIGLWLDSPWFEFRMAGMLPTIAGAIIAAAGLTLILASAPRHKQAGSNVEPWKPTTAIITTGLYAYTRNPIYLGMAITHAGVAIAGASTAALANLLVAVIVIQFYVIAREERYLEAKFGQPYLDYKTKVRRWV